MPPPTGGYSTTLNGGAFLRPAHGASPEHPGLPGPCGLLHICLSVLEASIIFSFVHFCTFSVFLMSTGCLSSGNMKRGIRVKKRGRGKSGPSLCPCRGAQGPALRTLGSSVQTGAGPSSPPPVLVPTAPAHPGGPGGMLWAFSAPKGHRQPGVGAGFPCSCDDSPEHVQGLSRLGSTWPWRRSWTDKGEDSRLP